jgi:nucleoid-associated protein YgaU
MVLCTGNQHGIAEVDYPLKVPATAPNTTADAGRADPATPAESEFYTVKSGDTLGKIAQEHYGAASRYTAIFEANQPMFNSPDNIYPGQKLRLPKP